MSLRQITIGSAAMSSVTILRMCAQFFILPLLARYIAPPEYGLIAIAMPFVLFAMMFSDAGLSASLIRTTGKDMKEWSTSFWFIIALGILLSLIVIVVGFIVSVLLSEPVLFSLISFLSLIIVMQSIATVPGASIQYRNKFNIIAGIEIISMTFSLVATCVAAINGWGAWSLVAQQLVHYSVKLILTLFYGRFKPHFVFDISKIKEHLIFGRDLLGSNFIYFIRESVRNMLLGNFLGTHLVGIYSMSALFSDLPKRVVAGPLQMVLYPRMSEHKDDADVLKSVFLFSSQVIAIFVVPVIGMIAVAHEPVFRILLSEQWVHSGEIFMLIAPMAVVTCVTALRGTVVMALGRTDIIVRQAFEIAVFSILALCVAVSYGLEVVAMTLTAVNLIYTPYALSKVFPLIGLNLKKYVCVIYMPLATTSCSIFSYLYLIDLYQFTDVYKFILAIGLGVLALVLGAGLQVKSLRSGIDYLKVQFT